jgi:hypothetical protein
VPLAGFRGAQARERLEALKKALGHRGKIGVPANPVEVLGEPPAGAIDGLTIRLAHHPVGLEMLQVPLEFFAIEVRKGSPLLRIQGTPGVALLSLCQS